MAQAQSPKNDASFFEESEESVRGDRSQFDIREEQIAHTKRILDLQIEGSRNLYQDALRIFLVDILGLGVLLSAGLVAFGLGGVAVGASEQISVVLMAFGGISVFVSMTFAAKAYLGDIANYGKTVTRDDGEDYKEKYLSRNIKIIKQNAREMEKRVDSIRVSLFSLVGGLAALILGLGFLVVPLDTWAEMAISLTAILFLGYLLADVLDIDYLDGSPTQFLR